MPAPYGVVPTGFNAKSLAEIIQEVETENLQAALFGPAIIQTAQTPLGQLNALFSDYTFDLWQLALSTYQSFDVDQADGVRLDTLGKLRNVPRGTGELNADYQLRITNSGRVDVSILSSLDAIRALTGVEWVTVRENNTDATDALGIPSHSLAFAVVGGTDTEVGQAIYNTTVSGIGLVGNTPIQIDTSGYCREIRFIRPVNRTVNLVVTVKDADDLCACSPPGAAAMKAAIIANLMGACGLRNADSVTESKVRAPIEALGGVEVVSVQMGFDGSAITNGPLNLGLNERALITDLNTTIVFQ